MTTCRSSDRNLFDRRDRVSILRNPLYDTGQAARQARVPVNWQ